jgi:serine/threonine protein kinase
MKKKFYSWDEAMNLREVKSLKKLNHPNIIRLHPSLFRNMEMFFCFKAPGSYSRERRALFCLRIHAGKSVRADEGQASFCFRHQSPLCIPLVNINIYSAEIATSPRTQSETLSTRCSKAFPTCTGTVRNITCTSRYQKNVMEDFTSGFFHRDMKPENIMCNGTELVKIGEQLGSFHG